MGKMMLARQRAILRFSNAKNAISQIRNNEWIPNWSDRYNQHLSASREGHRLWLGNGAFFCEATLADKDDAPGAFGLIWRHWVWWAAARKFKNDADRERKLKREIPKL